MAGCFERLPEATNVNVDGSFLDENMVTPYVVK
jgi:hypothetical protein